MQSLVMGEPSLLIALPSLQDPNFNKSVILLLEYDSSGAIGFVLNKKSSFKLDEIVNEDVPGSSHIPVWLGGPVGLDRGVFLHSKLSVEADETYPPGINISSSQEAITQILNLSSLPKSWNDRYAYRFVVGYAGWDAQQLDEEIKRGAWMQAPFDPKLVFNTPWQSIWLEAINNLGVSIEKIAPMDSGYLN